MRAEAKKLPPFLLHFQKLSLYLHRLPFETGDGCSPTLAGLAFFMATQVSHISTDPRVECLMASQPVSGGSQRESGTFFF